MCAYMIVCVVECCCCCFLQGGGDVSMWGCFYNLFSMCLGYMCIQHVHTSCAYNTQEMVQHLYQPLQCMDIVDCLHTTSHASAAAHTIPATIAANVATTIPANAAPAVVPRPSTTMPACRPTTTAATTIAAHNTPSTSQPMLVEPFSTCFIGYASTILGMTTRSKDVLDVFKQPGASNELGIDRETRAASQVYSQPHSNVLLNPSTLRSIGFHKSNQRTCGLVYSLPSV